MYRADNIILGGGFWQFHQMEEISNSYDAVTNKLVSEKFCTHLVVSELFKKAIFSALLYHNNPQAALLDARDAIDAELAAYDTVH